MLSCTAALETAGLLLYTQPGDESISDKIIARSVLDARTNPIKFPWLRSQNGSQLFPNMRGWDI